MYICERNIDVTLLVEMIYHILVSL